MSREIGDEDPMPRRQSRHEIVPDVGRRERIVYQHDRRPSATFTRSVAIDPDATQVDEFPAHRTNVVGPRPSNKERPTLWRTGAARDK
jgi:hypothetical protein